MKEGEKKILGEGRSRQERDNQGKKEVFEPPRIIEILDIEARAGVCNAPPTFGKDVSCDNLFS